MEPPRKPTPDPERIVRETRWLADVATGGAAGDKAMRALFDAYQPAFIKHLRWRGLSIEAALDITQNVWVDILRKAPTFRAGATPSSWLRGFLDIALMDWFRVQSRLPPTLSDSDDSFVDVVDRALSALHTRTPESDHALGALRRCVQGALAAFKRRHAGEADALYHRHAEDWSLEQVAEYRRSSQHSASQYLSQARLLFRPYLKPWPRTSHGWMTSRR